MINIQLLDGLLERFLENADNLLAAFLIDMEGLIISSKKIQKDFDEEVIGAIMAIIDQTITRIKRIADTSYGSGILDTNEFRLFYLELGSSVPALFVVVSNPYIDIEKYIPYSYLVAEKISLLFQERENINLELPLLHNNGTIKLVLSRSQEELINHVLLIGPPKTGKTSIVQKYVNQRFSKEYKPTIGVSLVKKNLQISQSIKSTLYLFDMGGLKAFAKIRRFFYKTIDAKTVIIVFDYTKEYTLNTINDWINEIYEFNNPDETDIILVGNKIDLNSNRTEMNEKAKIIAEQKHCTLFETSTLTGQGIDELFMNIAFK
ncbi:MAG: Small GTP-binding domain protein [Promethearchaeota archaeon]|nr:MAG: Small GTP-binding domain protein [Candidatus Lokiarchaeota archaeon]